MVEIRIDAIIRRCLAMRQLTLHYYSPMLVMAKRGLEEMHFDSLHKVKHAVLDIDPNLKTVDLPADCIEPISVGIEVGDKVRTIAYDDKLNKRDDQGQPFEQKPDVYLYEEFGWPDYYGFAWNKFFGRPVTFIESYTILRDQNKIRMNNKTEQTKILLVYLSLPEKISNKSVIHPYAQEALIAYIDWKWSVYNKDRDQELRRRDYYNELRKLRARMNKMTTTEIKRVVRKHYQLTIKN